MTDAFFIPFAATSGTAAGARAYGQVAAERFQTARPAIGPWSPDLLHGGPPAALGVRACERAARADGATDLVGLRASADFLGPVPYGELTVRSRIVRGGRRITLAEASVEASTGPVLVVRTWLLRTTPDGTPAPARQAAQDAADPIGRPPEVRHPGPATCPPAMTDWAFPYARAIEWRHVSGDPGGAGDAAAWGRPRIPLLPDEPMSGLQRAVLIADSGNGISAALDWDRWSFANVDLAVHLSRPVSGDWVLLDARTRYEPGGTGLATSVLHDTEGIIGTGAQILLISPRAGNG